MNKVWAFIPVAFAIFALMISPVVMSAYAAEPQSCNIEKAKHVGNKHCDNNGTTEPTQLSKCDIDSSGTIDNVEITTYGSTVGSIEFFPSDAQTWIDIVDSDGDHLISDSKELRDINQNFLKLMEFTCK